MLHGLVPILTLAAMLAHALLGCGWHHAHACAAECVVLTDAPAAPASFAGHARGYHDGCSGHAHGTATEDHKQDGEHRHPPCDEEPCKYVTSSKVQILQGEQLSLADAPSCFLAPVTIRPEQSPEGRAEPTSTWGRSSPLRRRALMQVWLL